VAVLRAAAPSRLPDVELNVLLQRVAVTERLGPSVERIAGEFGLEPSDVRSSPYVAVGPPKRVAEELRRHRDELGISYFAVREQDMESFAPVLDELRGT
jgi:hypothetical protein